MMTTATVSSFPVQSGQNAIHVRKLDEYELKFHKDVVAADLWSDLFLLLVEDWRHIPALSSVVLRF